MFDSYSSDDEGLDPERLGDERLYFEKFMPREWKFLFHWFEVVFDRFRVDESLRLDSNVSDLGRDKLTDWWIHVQHENDAFVSRHDTLADRQLKRYRTVRESVMLLTVMARVNYDAWMGELRRASRFHPPKWSNIRQERMPIKYCFSFYDGGDETDHYGWDLRENVFGHANFSKRFLVDFPRACAVAQSLGVDVAQMDAIPIKLRVQPPRETKKAQQIALLKNLTKTVASILKLEDTRKLPEDGTPMPPVFHLECVDLDFRNFEFHSTVLKEVQRLVETGVRIRSLTLPSFIARHNRETDETRRLSWATFLCAITGQQQLAARKAKAPSRRAVKIEHNVLDRTFGNDQRRLWAWMGYALFREGSSTSVEPLELSGFKLSTDTLAALAETMGRSALEALWRMSTNETAGSEIDGERSVVVKKGARATALGFKYKAETVVLPCDWQGTVITDGHGATLDVLLPGLGLCRVDREHIPSKRQKTSTPPREVAATRGPSTMTRPHAAITTLVVGLRPNRDDRDMVDSKPFVARLLELVGRPLRALHLHADGVDERVLDKCLAYCPHLLSLRLNGLSLATLQPLICAYQERGATIASLELRDIKNLTAREVEHFLGYLEPSHRDENAIRFHLRKLRIGRGWSAGFRQETAQQMERILDDPQSKLAYVHAYSNANPPYCWWHIRQFRGKPVESACLTVASRLAFLSVWYRTNPTADVAHNSQQRSLVERVFEFASARTFSVVIEDMDTDSSNFLSECISEYEKY